MDHRAARGRLWTTWAGTVGLWVAFPAVTLAGNDDAIFEGADAAITSGAVTAMVEDGTAAYYNPAGLAHIDRGQVDVSAQAIQLQSLVVEDLITVVGGPTEDGGALVIPMLPAGATFGGKLSDTLSWGGGIFVSNQFAYTLRASLQTEPPDDPLDVTVGIEQRMINTVGGVGLGWNVRPTLRLGVALMGRYLERYGARVLSAGEPTRNPDDPPDDGEFASRADSYGAQAAGAELRVGLQWEPAEHWVVGAAIWSPTIALYEAQQETGSRVVRRPGVNGRTVYEPFDESTTEWTFEQAGSWRIRGGVAYQASWGWVSLDGGVQPAFTNDGLGIERELVWNLRAGAKVAVAPGMVVGGGFFTDRSPVPEDGDRAFQARIDLYGGTVGFEFDETHRLAEGERASSIRFRTGLALRIAYGRGTFRSLALDPDAVQDPVTPNTVDARLFEASIYLVSGMSF